MVKVDTVDFLYFPRCPVCNSILEYKDTRIRKLYDYGGEVLKIYIRRLKCNKCKKLHSELPKDVVPRKRYKRSVIEDVLQYWIDHDDPIAIDGPSNITMDRWREEFSSKNHVV